MAKSMNIEVPEMAIDLLNLANSSSTHEVNLKPFFLDHALNRISESAYGINPKKSDNKSFFEAAQRASGSFQFSSPSVNIILNLLQHFPRLLKIFPFYNKDFDDLVEQSNAFVDDRAARGIERNDFAQMIVNKKDEIREKPKLGKILDDEIIYAQVI